MFPGEVGVLETIFGQLRFEVVRSQEERLRAIGEAKVRQLASEGWFLLQGETETRSYEEAGSVKFTIRQPTWFVPPEAIVHGRVNWVVVTQKGFQIG